MQNRYTTIGIHMQFIFYNQQLLDILSIMGNDNKIK